jgi:FdrA protein
VIFVGADYDALQSRYGDRLIITRTLAEAARQAVSISKTGKPMEIRQPHATGTGGAKTERRLAALFSGGTLCDEAMHIWVEQIGPIYSNIPLDPAWRLASGQHAQGHFAIDFGADEYTHGRPHPMIDPSLRLKRLQEEASNPQIGVILLDMVLGYCSHPDPATAYAPAIARALEQAASEDRSLTFVISLCGTEGDPQRLSSQAARFREAGAEVFTSNADAARRCIELLSLSR